MISDTQVRYASIGRCQGRSLRPWVSNQPSSRAAKSVNAIIAIRLRNGLDAVQGTAAVVLEFAFYEVRSNGRRHPEVRLHMQCVLHDRATTFLGKLPGLIADLEVAECRICDCAQYLLVFDLDVTL